jgi:hypothetical protein
MRLRIGSIFLFFAFLVPAVSPARILAVENERIGGESGSEELPDAPVPQIESAQAETPIERTSSPNGEKVVVSPAEVEKAKKQEADEQLDAQVHQRALGILPMFNITYLGDQTVSMTAEQKFKLAFRSSIDPFAFMTPFLIAGYHEAVNDQEGFPWGVKGLGERAGAAYLDSFNGNIIGGAILPSILHQDPRYYRMGYGSARHRLLYALATTVICRHDGTGRWEPNYSNVGGNLAAGALSSLYYPPTDEGVLALALSNGVIVTATGGAAAIFNEFWPDLSRKWLHKDPTNGLDAQRKAAHGAN